MLDEGTVLVVSPREGYYFGNDQRDWFREHLESNTHGLDVRIEPVSASIPNVAVQGPRSYELLSTLTRSDLASLGWFRFVPEPIEVAGVRVLLARAGFTGELGYELYLVDGDGGAERLWDAIIEGGARPFGLDAVELLRLEAGLVIAEEDYWPHETDPYDLSLDAFIEFSHDFVGKEAAAATAAAPSRRFVTLEIEGDVAPEAGTPVTTAAGAAAGVVRSAGVTPRFGPIALAVVTTDAAASGTTVRVGGRRAVVRGVPIDDPDKLRPRSDPRAPLLVD
jgi:aminomethyltransferase